LRPRFEVLAAKVLGIKPKPPLQKSIVRAAWISLVRIHHPDKGGVLEAAQAVNAAYQLLEKFSQ
jgi:curved DNA-binding protein CbpA